MGLGWVVWDGGGGVGGGGEGFTHFTTPHIENCP